MRGGGDVTKSTATVDIELNCPPELAPVLEAEAKIARAKAAMLVHLSILAMVLIWASLLPLVILAAKLTALAWGMAL